MLRKLYLLTVIFVFIFSLAANAKIGVELRGGIELFSPTEFNKDFTNVFVNSPSYSSLPDDKSKLPEINPMLFDTSLLIKFFVTDSISINLKSSFLMNETDNIVTIDDIDCLYSHAVFTVGYLGLGASYNLELSKNLIVGLNASGGLFVNLSSFWEVGAFDDPGAISKLTLLGIPRSQSVLDISDMFFGGDIEINLQYLFVESAGISLFGGYRIANYAITYPDTGLFSKNIMKAQSIDFSGPYFGGGFVFYIGTKSKPSVAKTVEKQTGEISKYEKYGDYYFKQKNYEYAAKYYSAALKTSPNPALYKKLGLCSYYMKDKAKTIEYMKKYIELNPDDAQIKAWMEKLSK